MKYTDRELEDILNKLIASTRSPRGRFSAASSYPQLEKKLNFRNHRLYLTRTFAAAAAVVLLCLSVWTAYLYMQPATIQTVSTLAETRTDPSARRHFRHAKPLFFPFLSGMVQIG